MADTKTTTTIEWPIEKFKALVRDKIFDGKAIKIEFVIQEVGGDPLDRYPGNKEVAKVRVSFDGVPQKNLEPWSRIGGNLRSEDSMDQR